MQRGSSQPIGATDGPKKGPNERHIGHVSYAAPVRGTDRRQYVRVMVKDEKSQFNTQSLLVASVRGGLALDRGLDVSFVVGTKGKDQRGNTIYVAVDVALLGS